MNLEDLAIVGVIGALLFLLTRSSAAGPSAAMTDITQPCQGCECTGTCGGAVGTSVAHRSSFELSHYQGDNILVQQPGPTSHQAYVEPQPTIPQPTIQQILAKTPPPTTDIPGVGIRSVNTTLGEINIAIAPITVAIEQANARGDWSTSWALARQRDDLLRRAGL